MAKEFGGNQGHTPPSYSDLRSLHVAIGDFLIERGIEPAETDHPDYRGTTMRHIFELDEHEVPPAVRERLDQIPRQGKAELNYEGILRHSTYVGPRASRENFPHPPLEESHVEIARTEYTATPGEDADRVGLREISAEYDILRRPGAYKAVSTIEASDSILNLRISDVGTPMMDEERGVPVDLPNLHGPIEPSREEVLELRNYIRENQGPPVPPLEQNG